jgi:hypothetical protein
MQVVDICAQQRLTSGDPLGKLRFEELGNGKGP